MNFFIATLLLFKTKTIWTLKFNEYNFFIMLQFIRHATIDEMKITISRYIYLSIILPLVKALYLKHGNDGIEAIEIETTEF